jgi:hypothetical protein
MSNRPRSICSLDEKAHRDEVGELESVLFEEPLGFGAECVGEEGDALEIFLPGENALPLSLRALEVKDFAEGRQTIFAVEIESLATVTGWLLWDSARPGIRFGDLQLDVGGQTLNGIACLLLEPWSLHVDLEAGLLDFDALRNALPDSGQGSGDGELPLEVRARLRVEQLRSSGVIAQGVELSLGENPDCD